MNTTITLSVTELMTDITNKSHLETEGIESPDVKYRIQVGTEKKDEIYRALVSVNSSLTRLVHRYLVSSTLDTATDAVTTPATFPISFVYVLDLSDRRKAAKAQPLADKMHDYLVHYTLAKFYASVSQGDLSNVHSALTQEASAEIESLLYDKLPPQ